jgi:hypothetical protein
MMTGRVDMVPSGSFDFAVPLEEPVFRNGVRRSPTGQLSWIPSYGVAFDFGRGPFCTAPTYDSLTEFEQEKT